MNNTPMVRVGHIFFTLSDFLFMSLHVMFLGFFFAISVGRCVIPWEFLGKSVKHIFSCREMYFV